MAPGHETGMEKWADMRVVVPPGMTGRGVAAQEQGEASMEVGGMEGEDEEDAGDGEMLMCGGEVDGEKEQCKGVGEEKGGRKGR